MYHYTPRRRVRGKDRAITGVVLALIGTLIYCYLEWILQGAVLIGLALVFGTPLWDMAKDFWAWAKHECRHER